GPQPSFQLAWQIRHGSTRLRHWLPRDLQVIPEQLAEKLSGRAGVKQHGTRVLITLGRLAQLSYIARHLFGHLPDFLVRRQSVQIRTLDYGRVAHGHSIRRLPRRPDAHESHAIRLTNNCSFGIY